MPDAARAFEYRTRSIRARLALWYTAAFAVLMTLVLAGGYTVLARATLEDVDNFLLETAGAVGSAVRESFPVPLPPDGATPEGIDDSERATVEHVLAEYEFGEVGIAVFEEMTPTRSGAASRFMLIRRRRNGVRPLGGESGWQSVVPVAGHALATMRPVSATLGGHDERVAAVPVVAGGHRFIVGVSQSLLRHERMLSRVREAIVVGLPLALLFAGAGGYLLARASLRPVDAMREQAATIGAGTMSTRLPVANDSDELGRLANTFNDLLDRVEAAFEHRRLFMADASHELRTPVAVLTAEAELALREPARTSAEYRDALSSIHDEARRLAHIVDDLFLLARGDASETSLLTSAFFLEELVADCADSLALLARAKGVSMRFTPGSEVRFTGDERLLRRLLVNVLDNAVKYTPAGGTVTIDLLEAPIRIRITDTGRGIPSAYHQRVFDRFFRIAGTDAPGGIGDTTGAGLGLPIAAWIAWLHGGSVRITDSTHRGTTFEITLAARTTASGWSARPTPGH